MMKTFLIEFTSNITGGIITYTWTNDNIEVGLADEGTGNLDFLATNNSEQPITANITVTPTFENGGNSNEGDPINFSITVNLQLRLILLTISCVKWRINWTN